MKIKTRYFLLFNLILCSIQALDTENSAISSDNLDLNFGHTRDARTGKVSVYFDISNSTFGEYRYYYFDFRPFASPDHIEHLPKQRLVDTHNSLSLIGLHEDDYVTCISFIDEYGNEYKPRSTCYEFTLGEKIVGSHHGGSSGYLAPLLLAFAFVIHVFIAVVHHLKTKNYAHRLLERFIDVNPKTVKHIAAMKQSLKRLDQPYVSASVQRRLSRVSFSTNENSSNDLLRKLTIDDLPVYNIPHHQNRKPTLGTMQTIAEHNP
ncbi:hypothetical protein I4U23_018868 [Adineta vaga]|nr:hypothetical protein I4U23_018868 [Adineta vaga]